MESIDKIVRLSKQKEVLYNNFVDRFKKANEELKLVEPDIEIGADEIKQTIENPPKKQGFPFILSILVTVIEVFDFSEFLAGISGIYTFLYGCLRLCVTIYLYYWAIRSLKGIKIIGIQRRFLKQANTRAVVALLSNIPLPYAGIFLRALPMDFLFILFTYYRSNKFVKLIWLALGQERDFSTYANVIRSKKGSDIEITNRIRMTSEREGLS